MIPITGKEDIATRKYWSPFCQFIFIQIFFVFGAWTQQMLTA